MADFQKLGITVKKMRADGVPDAKINEWLSQANIDLPTLNASGYGPDSRRADDKTSKMKSFGYGVAQGGAANFADEVGGAIAATIGRPTSNGLEPIPGQNWTDRYAAARDEIRGKLDTIQADNPKTFMAGNVVGAAAPMFVAPELYGSKLISEAPTMGSMMLRSGAFGGLFGGLNAFGGARGDPSQQATQTAVGTGVGAAIGAIAPPVIKGITTAGEKAYNAIKGILGGTETIAAEQPATMIAQQTSMPVVQQNTLGSQIPVPQTPLSPRSLPTQLEATVPPVTAQVTPNDKITAIAQMSKALQRAGYTVDQAREAINALGPEATISDISETMQRLLRTQKSAPGPAVDIIKNALENRQAGQQSRLIGAAERAFQTQGNVYSADDALVQKIADESAPYYQKAFEEGAQVDVKPVLETIDQQLAKMPKNSPIRGAINRVKGLLGEEVDGVFQPYTDLEMLHNSKVAIDDMLSSFNAESMGKMSKRAVVELKNKLLEQMDNVSSSYKTARETFSGVMTSREALDAGRAFMREDAEGLASSMSGLDQADKEMFRVGALRAVTDLIKSKPSDVSVVQQLRKTGLLEKVRELLPDDNQYMNFLKELGAERRFAETRASVLGGSQTAEKALDAADQAAGLIGTASDVATGNKAGVLSRLAGKAAQMLGPGEEARAMIAKLSTERDPVKVRKILEEIAAFQRSQALRNQATGLGAVGMSTAGGSAAGSSVGRQP